MSRSFDVSPLPVILHRARMHRNHLADRHGLRIVVPGLELSLEQLAMFIECLGHCISKLVRSIVAGIDEMIGPHDSGYSAVHSPQKTQRHRGTLVAGFLRELGEQW